MENLSQGSRKALGLSAPRVFRLVDLVLAGDGLDWPAVPCHLWLSLRAMGATLVQLKYLSICRFATSAILESKLAFSVLIGQ
jgi:hypothetical protein